MVPFTALLWFPTAILALIETALFDSTWIMQGLDYALGLLLSCLQYIAYELPSIELNRQLPLFMKAVLLGVVCLGLGYTSWHYFAVSMGMVMLAVLVPSTQRHDLSAVCIPFYCAVEERRIRHHQGDLEMVWHSLDHYGQQQGEIKTRHTAWYSTRDEIDDFIFLLGHSDKFYRFLLWPEAIGKLNAHSLLRLSPDWLVLAAQPNAEVQAMLDGLDINWLWVEADQLLVMREYSQGYSIAYSNCHLNLLNVNVSACERVEILGNMLN